MQPAEYDPQTFKCQNCGVTFEYGLNDLLAHDDSGIAVIGLKCPHCGHTHGFAPKNILEQAQKFASTESIEVKAFPAGNIQPPESVHLPVMEWHRDQRSLDFGRHQAVSDGIGLSTLVPVSLVALLVLAGLAYFVVKLCLRYVF